MPTTRIGLSLPRALACALLALPLLGQAKTPARLALLVGIDRYEQPDEGQWHALRGCENDVKLVREVLKERFGFVDEDIVTLTSEQATHAAIVQAFHQHLVRKAAPETKVVFWFSGHGSQVPDPTQKDRAYSGDYEPGKDQSMLAHDSRRGTRNGSHDLTDDEIHSLLAVLKARDVLFVSDCCHSGGLSRGGGEPLRARGEADGDQPLDVEALQKSGVWPKGLPLLEDDEEGRLLPHVLHVAACGAHEEAGEIEVPSGVHGTLTWFLCQTLREVPPDTSWRVVVETVRARIAGRLGNKPGQRVDVLGDGARAVLGGTARPVPSGYLVEPLGNGLLRVNAGTVHGIGSNTSFDLRDQEGEVVTTAAAESVSSSQTTLKPTAKVPYGRALWALPTGGLDGRATFRVRLPAGVDELCVANTGFAPAPKDTADPDYVVAAIASGFELRTGDGIPVGRAAEATALPALLFQEANFRFLWDAVGTCGERTLAARILAVPQKDSTVTVSGRKVAVAPARIDAKGKSQRARVEARPLDDAPDSGGLAFLEVQNQSGEDLHLAVLSVQEDRAVTLVFGRDENNLLRAGQSQRIRVQVGPSPAWKAGRPMIDRYLAFATPRWVDFTVFERRAPTTTRGGDDALPNLYSLLSGGERTRGGETRRPWGLTFLDLELVPPKGTK